MKIQSSRWMAALLTIAVFAVSCAGGQPEATLTPEGDDDSMQILMDGIGALINWT